MYRLGRESCSRRVRPRVLISSDACLTDIDRSCRCRQYYWDGSYPVGHWLDFDSKRVAKASAEACDLRYRELGDSTWLKQTGRSRRYVRRTKLSEKTSLSPAVSLTILPSRGKGKEAGQQTGTILLGLFHLTREGATSGGPQVGIVVQCRTLELASLAPGPEPEPQPTSLIT